MGLILFLRVLDQKCDRSSNSVKKKMNNNNNNKIVLKEG